MGVFVLVDSRIPAQRIDLEFMEWLGNKQIPFAIVFTKTDKKESKDIQQQVNLYEQEMLTTWEFMPKYFCTSAISKMGREELLSFIQETNQVF